MAYSSFYGGERGFSFILKKNFKTKTEMINNFKLGSSYKDVNLDEYVIIDTEDKNNEDNGKLYKRGYEYENDLGGAIYIGQIVGPAGKAPMVDMKKYDEITSMTTTGYDSKRSQYEITKDSDLIPGKYIEDGITKYNDKIKFQSCTLRKLDGTDSIAYLGFVIPYKVIDFEARTATSDEASTQTLIERKDDATHPFYEKWEIRIPKGPKGDSLTNLRVMVADNTIEPYEGRDIDISSQAEVLVYDFYNYENNLATGEKKTYYIGKYQWIKDTVIDPTTGNLIITLSDNSTKQTTLNCLIRTAVDNRYHLLALYSKVPEGTSCVSYDGIDTWVDLGYIGNGTGMGAMAGVNNTTNINKAKTMPAGSMWFILE